MKILLVADQSELDEATIAAVGKWPGADDAELIVLSVIRPHDLENARQFESSAEFTGRETGRPGAAPVMGGSQLGRLVVVPEGEPAPPVVEFRSQAFERASDERTDYLREALLRLLPGRAAAIYVEFGDDVAGTIIDAASRLGADAIAMGTHGRSVIRHPFLGSIPEQVTRDALVPVVLIGPRLLESATA